MKFLLLLLGCCAVLAFAINWLSLNLLERADRKAETAAARASLLAARMAASHAGDLLQDEAYNALKARLSASASSKTGKAQPAGAQYEPPAPARWGVDGVIFLDAEGKVAQDSDAKLLPLKTFLEQSESLRLAMTRGGNGFFDAGGEIYAAGMEATPAVPGKGTVVAAGVRKLSEGELQKLGVYSAETVRIIPFSSIDRHPELKTLAAGLKQGETATRRLPGGRMAAYTPLDDITGAPFALLSVETTSPIKPTWLFEKPWALLFFSLALAMLITATLAIFLYRKVFSRLNELKTFARSAGTNLAVRVPVSGSDEIAELASSLNGLVQALETDMRMRGKAEEELVRHEREYRALFESVPDAILMVDATNGKIVNANPAARALYGYTKDELLDLTSNDIAADHSDLAEINLDWTRRSPSNYHRKKDGSVFPVEISMSFSTQRWGKCCIMAVRDISRRKKAENIATAQHRLAMSLSAAKNMDEASAIILDEAIRAGKVAAAVLLRRTSDGTYVIVQKRGDAAALEQADRLAQIATASSHMEKGHTALLDRFHPEAKKVHFDFQAAGTTTVCAVPVSSGFKTVGAVICLFKTELAQGDAAIRMLEAFAAQAATLYERLEAVTELEANRRDLQNLFDSMQDMIFVCDNTGRIVYSNKAAKTAFQPERELQGRMILELHGQQEREKVAAAMQQSREKPVLLSSEFVRPDGKPLCVEINFSTGRWEGADALYAIARDITERRSAEQLREDMERAMRHDLKSPLTNLISIPEVILSMPNVQEDQKDWWRSVLNNARRMLEMINSSLDIYKMETGTYNRKIEQVDLQAALTQVTAEMEPLARLQNIRIELIAAQGQMSAQTDKPLFLRMLGHLLRNAVEASPRNGMVTVALSGKQAGTAQITIHNSGAIPQQMRGKIFQKYASFGKMTGTGLGTYSARLIAETIGAAIEFETSEETGTVMKVQLPAG